MMRYTASVFTTLLAFVAVVLVPFASATATSCSLFTTCIDCACGRPDYTVQHECKTGCKWVVSQSRCVSNSTTVDGEAYSSLWTLTDAEALFEEAGLTTNGAERQRNKYVRDGETTCSIGTPSGVIATLAVCFTLFVLQSAWIWGVYCKRWKGSSPEVAAGARVQVQEQVRQHIPVGDVTVWEGVATKPQGTSGGTAKRPTIFAFVALNFLAFCGTTIPSLVWLGLGLPTTVAANWQFDYYYSTYFTLGMVTFMTILFGAQLLLGSPKTFVKGYAITNQHVVIVTANATTLTMEGDGTGVQCQLITRIMSVALQDQHITFKATQRRDGDGSALTTVIVRLCDLDDARQLYTILQRMRPSDDDDTATVDAVLAVGSNDKVPTATDSLINVKPAVGGTTPPTTTAYSDGSSDDTYDETDARAPLHSFT